MLVSLSILVLSQVAYWLTVRAGDIFHFPAYPYYASSDGADAIVAGYVGVVVLTGLAAWMTTELVLIARGSARAWARGAAAAGTGVAFAGSMLGAAAGFLFDFSTVPSRIVVNAGLFGSAVIMMLFIVPSRRKLREQLQRDQDAFRLANGLAESAERRTVRKKRSG